MNAVNAISFEFADEVIANQACELLEELGYEVEKRFGEGKPRVNISVERCDLTSALEIAQAYGGQLVEGAAHHFSMEAAEEIAYSLDAIRIPAHTVAEDLPVDYMEGRTSEPDEDEERFDPSSNAYNYLSGDVHA
jgi:hypothetical protein